MLTSMAARLPHPSQAGESEGTEWETDMESRQFSTSLAGERVEKKRWLESGRRWKLKQSLFQFCCDKETRMFKTGMIAHAFNTITQETEAGAPP